MAHNNRWARLALRLRPSLADATDLERLIGISELYVFLTNIAFTVAGFTWLLARTEPATVRAEWAGLALLLLLTVLIGRLRYSQLFQLTGEAYTAVEGGFASLIWWTAAFIYGPTALWIIALSRATQALAAFARGRRRLNLAFATELLGSGAEILVVLTGLSVYERLGGVYPFPGLVPPDIWFAFAAVGVALLLAGALQFLSALVARSFARQSGHAAAPTYRDLLRFYLRHTAIDNADQPFAILAAGLYTAYGWPGLLFFLTAAFLTGWMASSFSRAVNEREQQKQSLNKLQAMAQALIEAPADGTRIQPIVARFMPELFPLTAVKVWLLPDDTLFETEGGMADVARAEKLLTEAPQRHHYLQDVPPSPKATDRQPREGLVVPIRDVQGKVRGAIYALRRPNIAPIMTSLSALQSAAAEIAAALTQADTYRQSLASARMAQELAVAGRIQSTFLPRSTPAVAGWAIAARLIPARQTSGDFYDFIPLPNGKLGFVVADVADKGTGAALYMALSRTLIRTYAVQFPDAPEQALAAANARILADTESDQFVTVFYAVLDPASGEMRYCNAGHNPAYVLGRSVAPQSLARTGIPLGMVDDIAWRGNSVALAPGELLLMYSDGLPEAQNAAGDLFDESRLLALSREAIAAPAGGSAEAVQQTIFAGVNAFTGDAPQADDMTLVTVWRHA